jgi:3-phytase
MWVFAVDPGTRTLRDVSKGGLPVFDVPMGVGLYRRPSDGRTWAILSRKQGPREGYLGQYLLEDAGDGTVRATLVRRFGSFGGEGEIEAVVVDDELGHVYYSDEVVGIHQAHADPDHPEADREIALFATDGFREDREGVAIWRGEDGRGYVVCVDQIRHGSRLHVYRREGAHEPVGVVATSAVSTDGIEVLSTPLGPRYPRGIAVLMDNARNGFQLYDWRDVEAALGLPPMRSPSANARK